MWKNETFDLGGVSVAAGQRKIVNLPIANLYTHAEMTLPVHVLRGKKPGPTLFLSAAIHGDELNGVEIIRRVLAQKSLSSLRGTLVAVPFVNGFGMLQHSRYLPDRRDLNRCFPGSSKGPLASRLAHIFLHQIVKHCDYGIDLHTGAIHRSNLPQIRANLDDVETREMAEKFGVPVLLNSNLRDGSLRESASSHGVKILLYEAGEALRLDELSIRAGVKGILGVMRHLDMLPSSKQRKLPPAPFVARSSSWIRAPGSGLFHGKSHLGDLVKKGSVLGTVVDPSNMLDQVQVEITSEHTGIIIGKTNIPLVNEGDAVFHIARFEDASDVYAELDVLNNIMPDEVV